MDKEKLKEKKNNIEKKINAKKEKLKKQGKKLEQKMKQKLAIENKQKVKLRPAIFEMLIVIVNRGRGETVSNYLRSLDINLNIVSFGKGTAPTNVQSLFGYNEEKEVLFTIVNIADSTKVLDLIDSIFFKTEKSAGIAFTIPLKSMTDTSIETLVNYNVSNNKRSK